MSMRQSVFSELTVNGDIDSVFSELTVNGDIDSVFSELTVNGNIDSVFSETAVEQVRYVTQREMFGAESALKIGSDDAVGETIRGAMEGSTDVGAIGQEGATKAVEWSGNDFIESFLTPSDATLLIDNPYFKGVLLLLFVSFALLVYLYRSQVAELLGMSVRKHYVDKLMNEQNYLFDKFVNLLIVIGVAVSAVLLVKLGDLFGGEFFVEIMPRWLTLLLVPVLAVGATLLFLFQMLLIRLGGWLTNQEKFAASLIRMNKLTAALATVVLTPTVLLVALSQGVGTQVLLVVYGISAALVTLFLLVRTYKLFVERKISILYWILYLCVVIIFPVSFLVLAVLRCVF